MCYTGHDKACLHVKRSAAQFMRWKCLSCSNTQPNAVFMRKTYASKMNGVIHSFTRIVFDCDNCLMHGSHLQADFLSF
eukprot:m.87634 g.87634  ORF g.87634 m.87634 type:complete len:78 (-) comp26098_c0_seq1:829-1062(-)